MKDPVCGMQVDPAKAAGMSQYQGQTFYFCSKGCKAKFDSRPEAYLNPQPPAPQPSGDTREYTCPMHPGGSPGGPRGVPDLRHGARTACRRRSRTATPSSTT